MSYADTHYRRAAPEERILQWSRVATAERVIPTVLTPYLRAVGADLRMSNQIPSQLRRAGFMSLTSIALASDDELRGVPNIGVRSLALLRAALAALLACEVPE